MKQQHSEAPEKPQLEGFKGDIYLRSIPIKMWANNDELPHNPKFWTSIEMIINFLEQDDKSSSEKDLRESILEGLRNTIKAGYNIEKMTYMKD